MYPLVTGTHVSAGHRNPCIRWSPEKRCLFLLASRPCVQGTTFPMFVGRDSTNMGNAVERIRAYCQTLLEVSEGVIHGDPAFFVGTKCFAYLRSDHHGTRGLALWCASSAEFRAAMLTRDPITYFVPPYVGHRGWLGVRLEKELTRDTLENHLLEAYCCVAPPRLLTF
jgi:hypothetical protein